MYSNLRKDYNNWHKDNLKNKNSIFPPTLKFYDSILRKFKTHAKKKPKLLDVACGTGNFLHKAKGAGFEIYGVDISDVAVKQAKKETGGEIKRSPAEKLPFNANTFDFVTCLGSLEHFNNMDKAVSELRRVVKPKGTVFVLLPNLMFIGHVYLALRSGEMPSEGGQEFSEVYKTNQGWKDLLSKSRLKVVKVEPYNDIFASNRVSFLIRLGWKSVGQRVVPFNFSYAFNYYCEK